MGLSNEMKIIFHAILAVASNIAAFLVAAYFVDGFTVTHDIRELIFLGALFGVLNLFLKPLMRIVLSPLVLLTFGFFLFIINVTILYLTDTLSAAITVSGTLPLVFATAIIGVVNGLLHVLVRRVRA